MTAPQEPKHVELIVKELDKVTGTPPETPAYFFKFLQESAWTVALGIMTIVATMLYGMDFDDALMWGQEEWIAFATGIVPVVGRYLAAFALTAVTGRSLSDGFSVS